MEESDSFAIIDIKIGDKKMDNGNNNEDENKNKLPFSTVIKIRKFSLSIHSFYF